jgi:hypothetical protein
MITPFWFQLPPRGTGASASVTGCPPAMSIFFSFPPAKNPISRLSGDQNGQPAPSVPAKGWAAGESRARK